MTFAPAGAAPLPTLSIRLPRMTMTWFVFAEPETPSISVPGPDDRHRLQRRPARRRGRHPRQQSAPARPPATAVHVLLPQRTPPADASAIRGLREQRHS